MYTDELDNESLIKKKKKTFNNYANNLGIELLIQKNLIKFYVKN